MIVFLTLLLAADSDFKWLSSYDEALRQAKSTGRPILIYHFNRA